MDSAKREAAGKHDGRLPSKIPPPTKDVTSNKSTASKVNKTVSPHSKIPKREVPTFSISKRGPAIGSRPPVVKPKIIEPKKVSVSSVNLSTSNSPRRNSTISSRSNLSTLRKSTFSGSDNLKAEPDLSIKSRDLTPRSEMSIHSKDKVQKCTDRVTAKNNILAFINIKEKVRAYQTEFMRKYEVVKNDLPNDDGEYKLIGLVRSSDGQLLTKNATKIKIKVKAGQKNIDDFKKELQNYVENNISLILDSLDQLKTSSGKIGDNSAGGVDNIEQMKMKIKGENLNALSDILKFIDNFEASDSKPTEISVDSGLEEKLTKLVEEVDEYRKNFEQSQKELLRMKKELKKSKEELEEKDKKLIKKQMELDEEIEKHSKQNGQVTLYREKAKSAEAEIQNMRQNTKALECQLEQLMSETKFPKDVHEELSRLQKDDAEKAQKIELLEMELTKAHFQNQKLEEKIIMDRKLLKVRCTIIESLQSKEDTQNILFSEVGERNKDIQMLKTELLTKTEEYQNLFSTLRAKQLELTRQEHVIKLLQESNERVQTLRVKQEARIERLEEEVSQLKDTLAVYQDAVLPNDTLRKNLLMVEASRDNDMIDTLGYYLDERRRKRHIDIKVKKYEK